ncbi:unnamed protein product [Caenorhabditis auriculariae]|uniref:G-protein coupled receptors family 1 profile domain-containing protein n=1 Tax=Caenorhabditis auriculariae TaxID=2777116 RepID=A0A8S1GVK3_9PELO|nr:unnamed protein product [Caenorhabditis auriculariae]
MEEQEVWSERPLSLEDLFAGSSLLTVAFLATALYVIMLSIMRKQDKEVVGYRFLFSAGCADVLLLFNYGVWPALTILFKSELIPKSLRHWQQLYLDWAWFSMVSHYSVVSWSRWMAIRRPLAFRNQPRRTSYTLCGLCYLLALVVVLSTHFQPWYVTFYYEPSSYGMLAENFPLYLSGGQSAMFLACHCTAILPPIVFYTWSIALLYSRKKPKLLVHVAQNNIESRLLLPCLINVVTFVIGQVVITVGTGEGKWAGYTVMLLFAANSAMNPLLLLICSKSIRQQVLDALEKNSCYRNEANSAMESCVTSEKPTRRYLFLTLPSSTPPSTAL